MSSKSLNILYVTPELSPLASTGGLAEVAGALPRALKARGHDVRCAMPCYGFLPAAAKGEVHGTCIAEMGGHTAYGGLRLSQVPDSDIPLYLIDHEGYFGRPATYGDGNNEYWDNAERFSFFCMALLDGIAQTGWRPDVVHLNDWATAPVAAFLKTRYAHHAFWRGVRVVMTIHNLAFQGRYGSQEFGRTGLGEELFTPEYFEYHGDMNLLKGAIAFADKINTVSPRYAKEIQTREYGEGLDGMLRMRRDDLSGIVNGVDYNVWHPTKDRHVAATFDLKDPSGKTACRQDLQSSMGLPVRDDVPVFGVVSRLYRQKGLDLLPHALYELRDTPFQLALLGSGEKSIEHEMHHAAAQYPDKVSIWMGYNAALSHKIIAGSDYFLMPSRYEPCGLSQLYSMAYGTIPIVRRTGGLADSVIPLNRATNTHGSATGIGFVPCTPQALQRAMGQAIALYGKKRSFEAMRKRGMKADFSWNQSGAHYVSLYEEALRAA
jgi:starch synthase